MRKILSAVAAACCLFGVWAGEARILRDIPYDETLGTDGLGDLHYPDNWNARTPVILLIHGGGWSGMHRVNVEGMARFLVEDLGMAVYNIEYRLASARNPWPACGDDCVKAANWLLSPAFADRFGLNPTKIWVTGGSAGGHLTLWTALSLPNDKLAGAVAVSPIGDPLPDYTAHPGRYRPLFGPKASPADLPAMDPRRLIRAGQAPILITHADADQVVPIASSRTFAEAYRAAGNRCDFYEYRHDIEPNEGGHFIWRPKSHPHKLLDCLERRMASFIREFEPAPPPAPPRRLFVCSFDGTVAPELAGGDPQPRPRSRNHRFVPGRRGQALEMKRGMDTALGYSVKGNLNLKAGTVAFWFKPDAAAQAKGGTDERRYFLTTKTAKPRAGSGTLWFWKYGARLRCDQSDDADRYAQASRPLVDGAWNHVVFTWGPKGTAIYLNGRSTTQIHDAGSPLATAMKTRQAAGGITFSRRQDFDAFFVGGYGGSAFMDGAMDDLEIWSAPLDADAVAELFRSAGGTVVDAIAPDYVKRFAQDGANPFVSAPRATGGVPGELELVDRWTLDSVPSDTNRFVSLGAIRMGEAAGVKYLEAGTNANDRFALRFNLGERAPLYCFEIDYPDDRLRTMDLVVQNARQERWDGSEGADYALQVGVAAGDEYPSSGRILTHRCLYWPRGRDVALLAMTARQGAPAAISEVRVYRIRSGTLPEAAVHVPPPNAGGWNRSFALYFEDPAIGYDFDVGGGTAESIGGMIDRVAALMKYTGQDLLCYPGAWYSGVIGDGYMPRQHAPDYRSAWYAKFDRAGLGFMPTVNQNNMQVPDGLVTFAKMENGALHPSCISIWETGNPNPGGWHGTPPNFNVAHPDTQAMLEREVEAFIAEGRGHPSFKGVVLHLTRHCLCWFGDIRAGYNDYCIDAFARAASIAVPTSIDRTAPLRGAAYAKWLQGDPGIYEKWLDWRCDVVAAFYRRLADKLRAARPDLKLVVNSFLLPDVHHPDFPRETFIPEANRRAGLDARKLADVPNISICQTEIPADYRFFGPKPGRWRAEADVAEPVHRGLYFKRGDYGLFDGAAFPWVNQHDRYFESACGAGGKLRPGQKPGPTLSCAWLKECKWRVTTINPAGRNALRHFAVPLRYHDVLAMSKGGFLIGTYGMEDVLVPFIQAFRALPAVKMDEVRRWGDVVMRRAAFAGRTYFYVVNTGAAEATVEVPLSAPATDLVTGVTVPAGAFSLLLKPYELRSYTL